MNQVHKLLRKVYRGVRTPLSLGCEMLLNAEGVEGLQKQLTQRRPTTYLTAESYRLDNLVVELTRKLLLPGDNEARVVRARETFYACEAENYRTNGRLRPFLIGNLLADDLGVASFITKWRKVLKSVLGPLPKRLEPVFTNGSTLSDKGDLTTIPDKMSSVPTIYDGSLDIWRHTIAGTPFDREVRYETVNWNRFFTVPKDSVTDRGCCIEASSAILMQRGVALAILSRYTKHYGVKPKYAKVLHSALAKEASLSGDYATIDLSNASDAVAYNLVKLVLPEDWFALLNSLRAVYTDIDGKKVRLEKFTSMGNGFTFELETLLFRTLIESLGVGRFQAAVFGDDIIVPTDRAGDTIACLRFFGFTPNQKKTFCEGPFRESCGGDFFDGVPVRAHYIKKLPDEPQHWVSIANGLRRVDPLLRHLGAAYWYCVDQVPVDWRNFGPDWLGDTVFNDSEAKPVWKDHVETHGLKTRYAVRNGIECRETIPQSERTTRIPMYRTKRAITRKYDLFRGWSYDIQLTCVSMGLGQYVSPRDSVVGYVDDWVPAYGCNDLDNSHWFRVNSDD